MNLRLCYVLQLKPLRRSVIYCVITSRPTGWRSMLDLSSNAFPIKPSGSLSILIYIRQRSGRGLAYLPVG
jgi:hypothetical protein